MIVHCIQDNLTALRQGIDLLSGLSADQYTRRSEACFNSSAGGHLRHVIEHYLGVLDGLGRGRIDYEARARDPWIENDPVHAVGQLKAIAERLVGLAADCPISVRAESESAGSESVWAESSLMRELEFLLSHTVHHYALIGVILGLAGHSLPEGFGVAPSTLRFRRKTGVVACAR